MLPQQQSLTCTFDGSLSLRFAARFRAYRAGEDCRFATNFRTLSKGRLGLGRPASLKCQEVEGLHAGRLQDYLWKEFFSNPAEWWDNRRSKRSPRRPDFRHKRYRYALWLNNIYNPDWVDSQLAMWDDDHVDHRMSKPPGFASSSVEGASFNVGWSEVSMCRKLCEEGQMSEAVDALDVLVQQEHHIPTDLFYRVLKRCIVQKHLGLGRRVHALTVRSGYGSDAFLANHLICMYASHRSLLEAMQVFSQVSQPDMYMWSSIILAFTKHGEPSQAIGLYRQMHASNSKPDNHVFVAVLKACASARDLGAGKDIHAHLLASPFKPDIFVQTCLVDMYAKCGSLQDARNVFNRLPHKGVVTWNAMIAGYAQQGMGQEALSLYSSMQQEGITTPDSVTFVCLMQACASAGAAGLEQGKQLHAEIQRQRVHGDVVLGASLVNMYTKCGSVEEAQRVFDSLSLKNVVTWTTMIVGYVQQGMGEEALVMYNRMQQEGTTLPDSSMFVCLLQACASVAALPRGKQLHAQIEEQGLQADAVVGRNLVNMYAKCGSLEDARQVFDSLPEREIVVFDVLIAGYARQGDHENVFDLVDRMRKEGIKPNGMTVLSVLTVCSHMGLVDKGRMYFAAMSTDFDISPTIEHYTCMVDILGRAGQLDEALVMVKSMPFQPDGAVWRTLLGACQKWNNVEVGLQAFKFAVTIDEKDAAAYVMMSNIYSGAQMWEEAGEMQARRVKWGACKEPGVSWWTDVGGVVHRFVGS